MVNVRTFFLSIGCLLLSANCLAGLTWEYSSRPDKMTGNDLLLARVESQEMFTLNFPYQKRQRATLTIRRDQKKSKDVFLRIDEGQFKCSDYECPVLVRFGDGKPTTFEGIGPSDNSSDMIFIKSSDRFLAQLRKVDKVLIQVEFYQNGSRTFEFDVKNFAYEKVFPTPAQEKDAKKNDWPSPPAALGARK